MGMFKRYMQHLPDGSVDVSQLFSPQCYREWLIGQGKLESDHEAVKYQRTLSNHLCGVDKRSPFEPKEEEAILMIVRRKQRWTCFPAHLKIGSTGFRSLGYHEKVAKAKAHQHQVDGIIASLSNAQDRIMVHTLTSSIAMLAPTAGELDASTWQSILDTFRFLTLAKTAACAVDYEAFPEESFQTWCNNDTTSVVKRILVLDLTANHFGKFIRAQNAHSKDYFGALLAHDDFVPLLHADLMQVIAAVLSALHQPGTTFYAAKTRIKGKFQEFMAHDAQFTLDLNTYLLQVTLIAS